MKRITQSKLQRVKKLIQGYKGCPQFRVKELIQDYKGCYAIFGPDWYEINLKSMGEDYTHPQTGERISFIPASTQESISISADGFGENGEFDARRDIYNPKWNQLGPIVRVQEGVFTNTQELNQDNLMKLLDGTEKVNGIYLINNGMAFAPYESFEIGPQEGEAFAHGGLARALEHTSENAAENLRKIASCYKKGVNVFGFEAVESPVFRVVLLDSLRSVDMLAVIGYDWLGLDVGYAFGVLKSAEGDAKK